MATRFARDIDMTKSPRFFRGGAKVFSLFVFVVLQSSLLFSQSIPDIVPLLASNNVTWNVPGPTSLQSMPIGNGDIGLNVWVETNGTVDLYIGKSDSWGDNVQGDQGLMKVGGARFTLNPNPMTPGASFTQTLMLHEGQIQITEGTPPNSATFLVWVDANHQVIRVEVTSGGTPVSVQASLLDWRLGDSNPDSVITGQTNDIGWYHRNRSSDDSHIANWTFGAVIQGAGMTNTSSTNLVSSAPAIYQLTSIYPLTTRTGTAAQWFAQLQTNINQINGLDLESTRASHQAWWDDFWHRSWIFVMGDQDAVNTTRGYVLQRFVSACAGRGAYPIKFNGSLFVVDNPAVPYTPDGRMWGGQYWMQNTREMYWPMLESGDFEMMPPFFNMYAQIISNNFSQVASFYGHGGSYSAETSPFWGGLKNESTNAVPLGGNSLFTDRYYEVVLELSMMMLDYYEFTGDTNFLANTLLPATSAGLDFYDQHFSLDANGRMYLYPVNSLETYWDTYDPAPDIAGLTAILSRMLALPTNFVSAAHQSQWTRMLTELPPLPTGPHGGTTVLLPYSGPQTNGVKNGENTQLYAIFPYRIYGLDKANLPLATNSYNAKLFGGLGWADWMPDAIQAAMIGLTAEAKKYTVYAMTNSEPTLKFPAFWRKQNDYQPSEDNGDVAMDALQKMILQTSGNKIMLQPAWPSGWNAVFKLNAPSNTTVQGAISNGAIVNLIVTPPSRGADVILMTGGGSPPTVPSNVVAVPGNGFIGLNWSTAAGALGYNVKRSLNSGGPYSVIANSLMSTNYDDASVAGGTTYYYVVSGVNQSGESGNSSQASATASLTIPSVPSDLSAAPGNAQISVSWTASSGATNYNIKRSLTSGGGYVTIASRTNPFYTDTGLNNGTTYYYVVSAQNSLGESANSAQVSAKPVAVISSLNFTNGGFSDNSVLTLVGVASNELYGVSLGDSTARTTGNGYKFSNFPNTNASYGGSGAYSPGAIFLGGGGTSGDGGFDSVLNNAELGIGGGGIILSNLVPGTTYNALFLSADTRTSTAGRAFSVSSFGSVPATSSSQVYAFKAGTPSLGGYILCTFVATNVIQVFTNNQSAYGFQLNGLLVASVPQTNYSLSIDGISRRSNDSLIINGSGGPASGRYRVLASTNLKTWTPIATNYFDSLGNAVATNPMDPMVGSLFYRLVIP